mgnify:CR=1 FL=1
MYPNRQGQNPLQDIFTKPLVTKHLLASHIVDNVEAFFTIIYLTQSKYNLVHSSPTYKEDMPTFV